MKNKGISGVGVIIIIVLVLVIGYIGFMIGRLQFSYGAIKGKAENAAEIGLAQADEVIIRDLIETAKDQRVVLIPEQIFVDHSLKDSMRIYVEYDDSSSIFGIYTYKKHFKIDVVKAMKMRD
jgi:hypothetical protein